jgi:LysM repeat protein
MTYFPESTALDEARRIVGEINLDLLISPIPAPEKGEHVVRSGEALVTIARRYETTIDYIMRANGKTNALIFPNESLIVSPLNFRIEIDRKKGRITVFEGERFFKDYAIVETNLPPELRAPVSTTVSEKVAWYDNRPVNFTDDAYFSSSKWLRSGRMGLFVRAEKGSGSEGEARQFGVMVSRPDMEELFTILRTGSPLALVN